MRNWSNKTVSSVIQALFRQYRQKPCRIMATDATVVTVATKAKVRKPRIVRARLETKVNLQCPTGSYCRPGTELCKIYMWWNLKKNCLGFSVSGFVYSGNLIAFMQFNANGDLMWKNSKYYPDMTYPKFTDFC